MSNPSKLSVSTLPLQCRQVSLRVICISRHSCHKFVCSLPNSYIQQICSKWIEGFPFYYDPLFFLASRMHFVPMFASAKLLHIPLRFIKANKSIKYLVLFLSIALHITIDILYKPRYFGGGKTST